MNFSPTNGPVRLNRRTLIGGLISLGALGGCANPRLFARNVEALAPNFSAKPKGFTRDEVAQFAAASISVSVGGSLPRLLLLQRVQGQDHLWSGTGGIVVQTRGARIVATGGLAHDLVHTSGPAGDPAQMSLLNADGARCIRELDFPNDYGMSLEAVSEFKRDGTEMLTILGAHIKTVRMKERVHVRGISWRHTNTFWFESANGRLWKSRQHTHPDLDAINMIIMRPASS